ncbi:Aste57867_9445 [Aphanomyces stellatus]|uniref:Aste57867_9445 protein n=1 Tax=Aphanomyces stellatus TaxID=120398 RepID=A0A485KN01_9STRA|nr:hypothetical protein As57867_009409 [Aphanomyces stellatus]VFT86325.1 Aste57867_9445 [Aphanomyces stellatus]
MLADRVLVDTAGKVSVTIRAPYTVARFTIVVSVGVLAALVMVLCLNASLAVSIVGIVVAFLGGVYSFCAMGWCLYGYEQFTLRGSTFTYEWSVPGTGIGARKQCDVAAMGPLTLEDGPPHRLGFLDQDAHRVGVGKTLQGLREKQELIEIMTMHFPAHIVQAPTVGVTICDAYYPMDTKPTSQSVAIAVPVVGPAEAHI